jgi:hypothetical protein
VRVIALFGVFLLFGCGTTVATTAKPTPTPTPDVGRLYSAAINTLHDAATTDGAAFYASKPGSTDESAAASKLATDYETLLTSLDSIPFPPTARDDLSAFKKTVVARQVFWSNVGIAGSNYSAFTDNSTADAYNQASILLGHDVGVTLVIQKPSPTPSA